VRAGAFRSRRLRLKLSRTHRHPRGNTNAIRSDDESRAAGLS
jgi:hypothetical protein